MEYYFKFQLQRRGSIFINRNEGEPSINFEGDIDQCTMGFRQNQTNIDEIDLMGYKKWI